MAQAGGMSVGENAPSYGSASQPEMAELKDFVNKQNIVTIVIWVAVIGVAFAYAWWKGYILRFRNYWNTTVDELRKCSWPTWDELKGSTVVVTISIALMGLFTYVVDLIFYYLVRLLS